MRSDRLSESLVGGGLEIGGGSDSGRSIMGDVDEAWVGCAIGKEGGLSVSGETSEVCGISIEIAGIDGGSVDFSMETSRVDRGV